MAWEEIASGSGIEISDVISYEESHIEEGQRARLYCESLLPIPSGTIDGLRNSLTWAGVEDLKIVSSGNKINIYWRKGFPWAAVILAALVLIIIVIIWIFYREAPFTVNAMLVAGIAIASVAGIALLRRTSHGT